MSKEKITPGGIIKGFSAIAAVLLVVWAVTLFGWKHFNDPITEKQSVDAELFQAYEYQRSTGKYSSETAYMGRFREKATGDYFDRELSGFFYHSFIKGGEKPISSWITVSQEDRGVDTPLIGDIFAVICFLAGVFGVSIFLTGFIMAGLEASVRDYQ
jgi:hypothetical protein